MQNSEIFTFEFLGMNTLELTIYIGMIMAVLLIIMVIVKSR